MQFRAHLLAVAALAFGLLYPSQALAGSCFSPACAEGSGFSGCACPVNGHVTQGQCGVGGSCEYGDN
ncbi:unnamed protein product [Zymoseptoria tritici ST99CH_1A5]|uniref:EGF-like domain-containing protein n=1 Tax=Zymoseptoria tritici ST99CH_1A5 TaxID=1276529 RepID=A0A1Y6LPR2_ZYMTR|nr:unnamed protein product [Zymoseptoria tritici ST99CH_1A5]